MAIYEGILYLDLRTEDLIESHNTFFFFLIYLFMIIQHKVIHIVELHTERKRENRSALCDTNKGHNTYTEQSPLLYSGTSIVRTSV